MYQQVALRFKRLGRLIGWCIIYIVMPNNREYGVQEVVYPTTVTLVADPQDKIKMFFCFNSQTPLIQYKGTIIAIVPGLSIYEPYTLLKCKDSRCPMVYSFAPLIQMSERYMQVL